MTRILFLFAVAMLLAACASNGPIIGSGITAALVALDQMLAAGTIDEQQYTALAGGLQAAGSGKITSPEGIGALATAAATAVGLVRLHRGKVTQRVGLPQSKVKPA